MKNSQLFLIAFSALFLVFSSCKKDKDDNKNTGEKVFWKIDDLEYRLQNELVRPKWVVTDYTEFIAAGINGASDYCSFSIQFKNKPTTSKTYKVKAALTSLKDDECSIVCVPLSSVMVTSVGREGDVVHITVTDGKVRAEFNNVKIEYLSGDEGIISGKVFE